LRAASGLTRRPASLASSAWLCADAQGASLGRDGDCPAPPIPTWCAAMATPDPATEARRRKLLGRAVVVGFGVLLLIYILATFVR